MLTKEITPLCNCENKELCNTSLHPWVPTSLGFFEVTWFYYLRARCPQKKVLWPYEFIWDVCTSYLKLFEAWQFQNNLADNLCMEQSIQELNIASLPPYTYFHSFSSAGRWAGMAFAVWVPMLALRRNSRLEFHLKCLGLSLKRVWRIKNIKWCLLPFRVPNIIKALEGWEVSIDPQVVTGAGRTDVEEINKKHCWFSDHLGAKNSTKKGCGRGPAYHA